MLKQAGDVGWSPLSPPKTPQSPVHAVGTVDQALMGNSIYGKLMLNRGRDVDLMSPASPKTPQSPVHAVQSQGEDIPEGRVEVPGRQKPSNEKEENSAGSDVTTRNAEANTPPALLVGGDDDSTDDDEGKANAGEPPPNNPSFIGVSGGPPMFSSR